ncbi:AI-2E family transporter, partial [Candidatus Peregrinibacteria bacterium]|nr:AI-2E family transporter [Candidatus Peregrinibacteria bacterium]
MKKILKKVASKYVDSLHQALSGNDEAKPRGKVKSNPLFEKERSMVVNRLPGYFLIFCIIGVLYLLYTLVSPFMTPLIVAAILTILFYGVYERLNKKLKMSRFASFLTCALVVIVIVLPIAGFIVLLVQEGLNMYETISTKIASGSLDFLFKWEEGGWLFDLKDRLDPIVDISKLDVKAMVVDSAQYVSSFLVSQGTSIAKNLGSIGIGFVIMMFSMFYLFKDGDKFVEKLTILSPLPRKYENEIIKRLKETVNAIAFGVFLTAIIQGTLAGIGFTIAGVSNPIFWGAATALFSIIPMVGTAAIWFPAAIITFALGNYVGGVFLFLWGMFIVGTVDNLVRPYLIGTKAHIYPLLTFFVVLGGLWTFGLQGLIIGP